ncbi:MAG: UDP-N-acetylmuramoyl-L-alanine--D-glutamate ligase, partial [Pseudomonadales bacterium]|nr:UDP-N-acetylmuramoyl-L-alanine--D-glutamate ligase [Pseudomonadales bacterium]
MSIEKEMTQKHSTVVFGLGKTGLSCARFLAARGVEFCVADTREHPAGKNELKRIFPDVNVFLGEIPREILLNADQILLSPGIAPSNSLLDEARKSGVSIIGDLEMFVQHCDKPIIAITGSNAKTTVTSLLGYLAAQCGKKMSVAGNIGTPMLDVLDDESEAYILELSSFQLDLSENLQALAATVLNISEDHLDRYASMNDYISSKQRIYRHAKNAVFNRADKNTEPSADFCLNRISFGLDEPVSFADFGLLRNDGGKEYIARGEVLLLPVDSLMLKGRHNLENVMAALALGE